MFRTRFKQHGFEFGGLFAAHAIHHWTALCTASQLVDFPAWHKKVVDAYTWMTNANIPLALDHIVSKWARK